MTIIPSSPVVNQQLQHRSVRKFTDEPISDNQLETIITAAQRASTSSNLNAWSVIAVRDQNRKNRLAEALGGHKYISTAAVFLAWIVDFARNESLLESRGVEAETIGFLETNIMGALDVGIAAQNALLAAESLGLGGVFVGGIRNNPEAVAKELALPQRTFAMVGMSLGTPDPSYKAGIKPRLPLSGLLHFENYDQSSWREATESLEYENQEYFESQGHRGRSWAASVSSRIGPISGMHGRHTLRDSLKSQGFENK